MKKKKSKMKSKLSTRSKVEKELKKWGVKNPKKHPGYLCAIPFSQVHKLMNRVQFLENQTLILNGECENLIQMLNEFYASGHRIDTDKLRTFYLKKEVKHENG